MGHMGLVDPPRARDRSLTARRPAEHDAARARAIAGADGCGSPTFSPRSREQRLGTRSNREEAMNKVWASLVLAGAGCLATGTAQAEPVKIAIIESLFDGLVAVGIIFLPPLDDGL